MHAWQHMRELLVQGKDVIINGKVLNFYCNLILNVSVSTIFVHFLKVILANMTLSIKAQLG